jgi:hypothetical protein
MTECRFRGLSDIGARGLGHDAAAGSNVWKDHSCLRSIDFLPIDGRPAMLSFIQMAASIFVFAFNFGIAELATILRLIQRGNGCAFRMVEA